MNNEPALRSRELCKWVQESFKLHSSFDLLLPAIRKQMHWLKGWYTISSSSSQCTQASKAAGGVRFRQLSPTTTIQSQPDWDVAHTSRFAERVYGYLPINFWDWRTKSHCENKNGFHNIWKNTDQQLKEATTHDTKPWCQKFNPGTES